MNSMVSKTDNRLANHFAGWIDPANCQKAPIVLIGAGLSFGLVPRADEYAREIELRKSEIEDSLGITSSIVPVNAKELYRWAGCCRPCSLIRSFANKPKQRREPFMMFEFK